jgi:hypothetical protein
MEGMVISRRQCRDASIVGTRGSALHSCEIIGTETTKNKDRNEQVDDEKFVQSLNNDYGSNCLTPGLKQINQLKPHNNISSEPPESQTTSSEGFFRHAVRRIFLPLFLCFLNSSISDLTG